MTNPDRWDRILASVRHRTTPGPVVAHLCALAKDLLSVDHVSICLAASGTLAPLGGSDAVAISADQIQNLWGLGPSILAATSVNTEPPGGAVLVEDVNTDTDLRWPLISALSGALDLCGVAAFPLRTGGAHLGVLTGYTHRQHSLSPAQLADGLVLATVITEVLLGIEALSPHVSRDSGNDVDAMWSELLDTLPTGSLRIHQAAGMLAERLHITMLEAQIRLRALAFRRGETLEDVSHLIITHHPIPELEV